MTTAVIEISDTKQRLLEAAGEVFADHGFADATVRDICDRADANIAAINYHFQGKERLYAAVLRYAYNAALERFPPTFGLPENPTPRQRLHSFVRAFLLRMFDDGRPAWFGRLLSREMLEPTAALDELVNLAIKPQQELLITIIRSIAPGMADADARLTMFSVIGQALFYHHCRSVIDRTSPFPVYTPEAIDRLAEHITAFSYSAIEARQSGRTKK